MKQGELDRILGVSKAYVSIVISGKKKPSKQIAEALLQMRRYPRAEPVALCNSSFT